MEYMKWVFISGKITGDPDFKEKFKAEEGRLSLLGYSAINPARLIPGGWPWNKSLRAAIRLLVDCDGVSLLPDWKDSRGAVIEERLARELEMDVRESEEWA